MLAGPPRLVSFVSILLFLLLGWRIVHTPTAAVWRVDSLPPRPLPNVSVQHDPLDFSIPLRFSEGVAKPSGSNYSWKIVIPKTEKEELAWLKKEDFMDNLIVYEVDNPHAEYKVPKNKGREAMVYLTYMIDHYDNLPDIIIFMHAHRYAWHNNLLQGQDQAPMLKMLNYDRVQRLGYMNLRCHHEPGCPDWIHMDRPGGDFDFFRKPEEIYWRRHIWEEIHPGAPIPTSLSGVCCAQFALSSERIRQVPIERLLHYRRWLMDTGMDDQYSGRIFEYIWHYIFTGHEVHCPAQNSCYCDGYGICFGGRQKYDDFWERQKQRDKDYEELDVFVQEEDKAKEEGTQVRWNAKQRERIEELNRGIAEADRWLEEQRKGAFERGRDPKARKEETETWDSSKIWDYAPLPEEYE